MSIVVLKLFARQGSRTDGQRGEYMLPTLESIKLRLQCCCLSKKDNVTASLFLVKDHFIVFEWQSHNHGLCLLVYELCVQLVLKGCYLDLSPRRCLYSSNTECVHSSNATVIWCCHLNIYWFLIQLHLLLFEKLTQYSSFQN